MVRVNSNVERYKFPVHFFNTPVLCFLGLSYTFFRSVIPTTICASQHYEIPDPFVLYKSKHYIATKIKLVAKKLNLDNKCFQQL